jgi:hypothetical protein
VKERTVFFEPETDFRYKTERGQEAKIEPENYKREQKSE